jgi:Uncharacterized protein conserved in bacteria (DUF2188)
MTKANDDDRIVQPREQGGWEVVKEDHERASAVTRTKRVAIDRAREIVETIPGGEVRIKNLDGRYADSDTQPSRSHRESSKRDRK